MDDAMPWEAHELIETVGKAAEHAPVEQQPVPRRTPTGGLVNNVGYAASSLGGLQDAPRQPQRPGSGPLPPLDQAGGAPRPGTGSLGPLNVRPPSAPPPGAGLPRKGTGDLPPPPPSRRDTGELPPPPPLPPRRGSGPLGAPQQAPTTPAGSWEYRVLSQRGGMPLTAVIELAFLEARAVPVRKRLMADRQGWIVGRGLPPGAYQLTVQAAGHHPISEVRQLNADAPDHAVFHLQPI